MNEVYLLLGSNIEPRLSFLQEAGRRLADLIGNVRRQSSVYESEPWGFKDSRNFLNRVVIVETGLVPQEVLKRVLSIETEMGRQRHKNGYSSRQIDIDILYFNKECIDKPGLKIPHPGIPDRRFVLVPLEEIEADFIHPVLKKTHVELLKQCRDDLKVWNFSEQRRSRK